MLYICARKMDRTGSLQNQIIEFRFQFQWQTLIDLVIKCMRTPLAKV